MTEIVVKIGTWFLDAYGIISQKQINDSVRRILQLKEKLCILK